MYKFQSVSVEYVEEILVRITKQRLYILGDRSKHISAISKLGSQRAVGYFDDNTEVFDGIVATPPHLDISRFFSRNNWCSEGQAGTVWKHIEP